MSRAWYGGDFAAIVGECECQGGMVWNDNELQCQVSTKGCGVDWLLVIEQGEGYGGMLLIVD